MNYFVKRLRREIGGSPKKGALLGVMVLVGIYFWAPLVAGWLGGKPGRSSSIAAGLATASTAGPTTGDKTAAQQPWYVLSDWIRHDPLKRSVGPREGARDPFVPPEDIVNKEQEPAEPPMKAVATDEIALALGGTILGPHGRMALINGKSYREGDSVKISCEGQTIVLKLVEIGPQNATLDRDGNRVVLKMSVSPLAEGIKVVEKSGS